MTNKIRKFQNAFELPEVATGGQIIIPEDLPILKIMVSGNVVEATCKEHLQLAEVVYCVNRESKRTGWICATDYPRKECGAWVWRFVQ